MVKLEDYTHKELKTIVRKYNKHVTFKYSKLNKKDLIEGLRNEKNLEITETDKGIKIKIVDSEVGDVDKEKKERKKRQPKKKQDLKKKEPEKKQDNLQEENLEEEVKTYDELSNEVFQSYFDMKKGLESVEGNFPPFICSSWVSSWINNFLLERNSNDCFIDLRDSNYWGGDTISLNKMWGKIKIKRKTDFQITYNYYYKNYPNLKDNMTKYGINETNKPTGNLFGGFDPKFISEDGFLKIKNRYFECKKKDLMLVMPVAINSNNSSHRNIIIINPITKTFEYYEPHGEAIKNKGYDTEQAINISQKYIMDFIDDDLKFIPPSDTCPRRPKNMPKKRITKEQVTYKEAIDFLRDLWLDDESFEENLQYNSFIDSKGIYYLFIKLHEIDYYYIKVSKKIYDKLKLEDNEEGIKKYFKDKAKIIEAMYETKDREVLKVDDTDKMGFQSIEGDERYTKNFTDRNIVKYVEDNKVVYEVGGYCCMWSFFMMDLRLKFKDKEPKEIFTDFFDKIYNKYDEEGNNPFVTFIRSFTFNIMSEMDIMFNDTFQILKKVSTNEDDRIVLIVNGKEKVLSQNESDKYEKDIEKDIRDKVKQFLDLSYSKKLKKLLDNSNGIKII